MVLTLFGLPFSLVLESFENGFEPVRLAVFLTRPYDKTQFTL
jgi:hypothetical protein